MRHLLATCLATAMSIATADAQDDSLEAVVDRHLQPYIDTGNFSGSVLIAKKGEILLAKGYGWADPGRERENRPDTAFYLASTARVFTSAAVMRLVEKGLLSVDDPVADHLPDWPHGDEMTVHHLLTLSSGIRDINGLWGYGMWSFAPQTPTSLCEKFRDLSLEFPPGTRTVHSNSNYVALALLIEVVTGKSFGEAMRELLFEPLGMARTAHDDHPDREVEWRADGQRPVGLAKLEPHGLNHWSVKTGHASLYSTVEDLYRMDRMLADATLLSEASIDALFTQHFPGHGYGWFVRENEGATEVIIGGRSPGFGSSWIRSVDSDTTVIVLGNVYNGVPPIVSRDLLTLVMGGEVEPPALSPDPPDPDLLQELAGTYQFGADFYRPNGSSTFTIDDGHLFSRDSWLIPMGELTFVHRTYWSTLVFERNAAGRIDRLRYDHFVGERID